MKSPTPEPYEARLTEVWAEQMPLTRAMGVTLAVLDEVQLEIRMPMGPNRNHKGTVFGGSVSALATLAGWSAVWLLLVEAGVAAHTVIQDSRIRYTNPGQTDVVARVIRPGPIEVERFLTMVARRGRGRIGIAVTVRDAAGQVVAEFEGRYVAASG
ncbi:MAG: YiiD C-terminal domain-containing protein [Gemmatimonadota bacterium]